MIGDGCPGATASTWPRSRATSALALRRAQDAQGGEGGGGVARGGGGGEDERPGRVDEQVDDVAVGRDEAAERAERLRQRADPHDVDVGARRTVGPEHGVGLVEHEQRAVAPAHLGQRVDRRLVAVHREHRVGDDERRAVVAGEQLVDVGRVGVAGDGDLAPARAGRRR